MAHEVDHHGIRVLDRSEDPDRGGRTGHASSPERSRVLMDIPADAIDTAHTGFIAHDVLMPPSG